MEQKAQGSLEYILMLGGVLLLVVLVISIMQSNVFKGAKKSVDTNYNNYDALTNTSNCSLAGC